MNLKGLEFDNVESMMKMAEARNKGLEDELGELMNEDPELMAMYKKDKKKKNLDCDDLTLSDLDSDKEEDILENMKEEEEMKEHLNEEIKRNQHDKEFKIKTNFEKKNDDNTNTNNKNAKKDLAANEPIKKKEQQFIVEDNINDDYDEKYENFYHRADKMKAISLMEAELQLIQEVVELKRKKNLDSDFFMNKKDILELEINKLKNNVNLGILEIDDYKFIVNKQKEIEIELLKRLEKDDKVKNKEFNRKRIQKRLDLIELELSEEPPVEEDKPIPIEENKVIEVVDNKTEVKNVEKIELKKEKTSKIQQIQPETDKIISKTKKNEEMIKNLSNRLDDYKKAFDYFLKIENTILADDAKTKSSSIRMAISQLENDKEIDEFTLPYQITPEYICGCTQKERIYEFMVLIKYYIEQKKELQNKLNEIIKRSKKLEKRDFIKNKDLIKKELDKAKNKIDTSDNIIKKMQELAKNPWIPCPLYSIQEEEEKIEKVNDDIEVNMLMVYIGNTSLKESELSMTLTLKLSEEKVLSHSALANNKQSFDCKILFTLVDSELRKLHKKTIEIIIEKNCFCYWLGCRSLVGKVIISLKTLSETSVIKKTYPIIRDQLKNVNCDNQEVEIKLRQPTAEKEYLIKSKTCLVINKIFPPFKGEGINIQIKQNDSPIKGKMDNNSNNQPVKLDIKNNPEIKLIDNKPKKEPEKLAYDKAEFSDEELDDPDHIDNLNSLYVLEFKSKKVQLEFKKIEGRIPRNLRDKFNKIGCKMQIMTQQAQTGMITDTDYLNIMRKQLDHDRKLVQYFTDQKNPDKAKIVNERVPILIKEIEEGIKAIKK